MLPENEYDIENIVKSFKGDWCLLRYHNEHVIFGPKEPTPIPNNVACEIIHSLKLVSEPCKLFKDEIIWKIKSE
jgi:hypothetical protein